MSFGKMFALNRANPDPGRFMELFCSWEMSSWDNKWQGRYQSAGGQQQDAIGC